ncbi:MAG TPA: hypothetical protein VFH51_13260, partial [Myxococcota bacterium]|nr:hypothetical protein [Myxococcota bacterium]
MAVVALLACATARVPAARRGPEGDRLADGAWLADPYRWLEDDRNPEVVAWARDQDARTRRFLDALPQRRELRAALEAASSYPRMGPPWRRGGRTFVLRNAGREPHDVLWVSEAGLEGGRALLEPSRFGPRRSLAGVATSRDGRRLAYAVSESGTDWQTWRVRDVDRGIDTPDEVSNSKFSTATWQDTPPGFYYVHYPRPPAGAPASTQDAQPSVRLHLLGQDEAADREVFRHPDPAYTVDTQVTDDGRWLVVFAAPGDDKRSLVYLRPLATADAPMRPVVARLEGRWTLAGSDAASLWFVTTQDAPRGRLVRLRGADGAVETVVPQGPDTLLRATHGAGRFVLQYLRDARAHVVVVDERGANPTTVPLPGVGAVDGFDTGGAGEAYYVFNSPTTPPEVWHLDLATVTARRIFAPRLAFEAPELVTHQDFVASDDGTRVSAFVSHAVNLPRDGTRRVRLYGYGGFNAPVRPTFNPSDYVWMARGGVFAAAVIRGGGEY